MKLDQLKTRALVQIQRALGYSFKEPTLLVRALTHRSFSSKNNERFEFVGDSILNYTVAIMLFEAFPTLSEGELSRLRANLVNEGVLAEIAVLIKVGEALFLGQGELKSGGFNRSSILADAMEARGYDGTINVLERNTPAKKKEMILLAVFELVLIIVAAAERMI